MKYILKYDYAFYLCKQGRIVHRSGILKKIKITLKKKIVLDIIYFISMSVKCILWQILNEIE